MKKAKGFKILGISANGSGESFRGEEVSREERDSGVMVADDVDLPLPSLIGYLKRDCIKNRRNYLGER